MWIEVTVEHECGIVGVHYVEVSDTLRHPEANAKRQEEEKGFTVIATRIWGK